MFHPLIKMLYKGRPRKNPKNFIAPTKVLLRVSFTWREDATGPADNHLLPLHVVCVDSYNPRETTSKVDLLKYLAVRVYTRLAESPESRFYAVPTYLELATLGFIGGWLAELKWSGS